MPIMKVFNITDRFSFFFFMIVFKMFISGTTLINLALGVRKS